MANSTLHGLVYTGTRFETTTLGGSRKSGPRTPHVVTPEPDASLPPLEDLLAPLRRKLSGDLHLAIPASGVLLHTADYPSNDPDELAGMVELSVEDLTPYPVDRTYAGWERVSSSESGSRVVIALTARQGIDALHESLSAHHLLAHRVDVDILCWWHLIRGQEGEPSSGTRLLLVHDSDQLHLLVTDARGIAALTSMGNVGALDAESLAEDLDLALAGMEADLGSLDFAEIELWDHGGEPGIFEKVDLSSRYGAPLRRRDLNELPSLSEGVARRGALAQGERVLDLSPPTWKEEEATRLFRKRLLGGGVAVAALWMVFAGALTGLTRFRENQVRSLRREVENQRQPVERVTALSEQVRSLSQFTDRSFSALEVLRVLAEAVPPDGRILVRDVHYRKHEGVNFSGEATGDFFRFQEVLSESEILRVLDFDTTRARGVTEFRVSTRWRWLEEGDAAQ